jgi:hypothetical protein
MDHVVRAHRPNRFFPELFEEFELERIADVLGLKLLQLELPRGSSDRGIASWANGIDRSIGVGPMGAFNAYKIMRHARGPQFKFVE